MSAPRKQPAAPDMVGLADDWSKLANMRRQEQDPPAPAPAEAPRPATPAAGVSAPAMTRRSWYVEQTAADALSAAVDDIHFATRAPKHEVLAALIRAAVAQAEAVKAELSHP